MRTICVMTGTRAEYGLLRWVMEGIVAASGLRLQVVVTGMHLSPEYGSTYLEIERDGFTIDRKVEAQLSSDTGAGVAKSMALATLGFADALADLAPDVLVVLGDRYEVFAAASAALFARIPVAHIHGGEVTEAAVDDSIRHAVTKLAHLHFVAADEYRRRVIQLGEDPERVFQVGGLGLDGIRRHELFDREQLERELDFELGERSLLVTFHPETLADRPATAQVHELLAALDDSRPDTRIVFTMPNSDAEGWTIREMIEAYVAARPNARGYVSLGQRRYLSLVKQVDAVVGNSSSGIMEAPSLGTPTVNIGRRQRGRLRAGSIVDCEAERHAIATAIETVFSDGFRRAAERTTNPYGEGGASDRIVDILASIDLGRLCGKRFHDLGGRTGDG
jgi:GDP/UDP-N,N'-diacetylbacillosamine 2-epimerase (hydrolysing)